MTDTKIAVLGLGRMGQGMAGRLLDAGFEVAVYNRTPAAADALVARGARRAHSPADAIEPGGIAITMLANDAALDRVTLGEDGFLARLGAGGVHLSMSTIGPSLASSLAARHSAIGATYLGAPVFGRPEAAAAGKLWVVLAGEPAAKARAQPCLAPLSQGVYDLGEAPAAAHVAKISGNFLIAGAIEMLAESFALVAKNGGDPRGFHKLMSETLFDCPIYRNYGRAILDRSYTPPGFTLELGAKDVGLVLENGRQSETPLPIASLLRDRFLSAMARGRHDLDWSAIALGAAEDAGLKAL